MSDVKDLIGILSGDAPAPVRRRALREAHLDESSLGALVDVAKARRSDQPQAARQIAAGVLAAGRSARLPEVVVQAARVLVQTNLVLGKPKNALRLLRRYAHEGGPAEDASVTLELAQTLSMLGMRREAQAAIEESRGRMPDSGAEYQLALLDIAEASLRHGGGEVEDALALIERARPAIAEYGTDTTLASVDLNRATLLTSLDRYDEAERLFREASETLEQRGRHSVALQGWYGHAFALMRRGQYHDALRRFDRVRREFHDGGNRRFVAACQLAEAEINLALNLPSQAWQVALEARRTFHDLGITDEQAKAEFVAALAARGLGRTVESLHRLEAAYQVFARAGGCSSYAALCLYRLAEADRDVQETGRAAVRAERAVGALRALGWHERAGRAAVLLAELEMDAGELRAARIRLDRLLHGEYACRTPWVRCEVLHKLALAEELMGNRQRAALYILRATRILERYRVVVPPDEYMAAFLTGRAELFDDAIRIITHLGGRRAKERAFELSEQARARALLDLIRTRGIQNGDDGDTFEDELGRLERRVAGGFAPLPDVANPRPPGTAERRIHNVSEGEVRLRRCLDTLALTDPDRARALRGAPIDLETLCERLPADATLVEYFLAADELFVFVVTRDGLTVHRKALDRDLLRRHMSRMRFQLERPRLNREGGGDDDASLLRSASDVMSDLNDKLLGTVRSTLTTRRVVIVPHGELHGVPFPALEHEGRPLIEDHEVVVAPSAAIYMHCLETEVNGGTRSLLLGADDERAPNVGQELRQLEPLLPEVEVHSGLDATIRVLASEGQSARIIHLAAHTEYRHDDPMQSRIRLADGWLTIPTIYDLKLAPELLVLSGCATGRVAVTGGGDLFGLVRGFLHAGAPSLLTSLWEVSDERTLDFMREFYRALPVTGCAAAALRRAALQIRARHPHPYYWAPFVLTGRGGRPATDPSVSDTRSPVPRSS